MPVAGNTLSVLLGMIIVLQNPYLMIINQKLRTSIYCLILTSQTYFIPLKKYPLLPDTTLWLYTPLRKMLTQTQFIKSQRRGEIALRGAGRNFLKGLKWSWNIYPRPSPASNRGISSEHSPNLIKHTGFIAKLMIPWTSGNSI